MDAILKQLNSDDAATHQAGLDALDDLVNAPFGGTEMREVGPSISQWSERLLATKLYPSIETLGFKIMVSRGGIPVEFEIAARMRVKAFIGQRDFDGALPEAKVYYDSSALADTPLAANLVAQLIAKVQGVDAGRRFLKEQAAANAAGPTSQPSDLLKAITVDSGKCDFAIQYLQELATARGISHGSLISQGNYYLAENQPDEARACFEEACRLAQSNPSKVRVAIEGIARSMRAQDGNPAHAVAFIQALCRNPSEVDSALIDDTSNSPRRRPANRRGRSETSRYAQARFSSNNAALIVANA